MIKVTIPRSKCLSMGKYWIVEELRAAGIPVFPLFVNFGVEKGSLTHSYDFDTESYVFVWEDLDDK